MKKLLALVLVLAIAPLASAALILNVNGAAAGASVNYGSYILSLSDATSGGVQGYFALVTDAGSVVGGVVNAGMPDALTMGDDAATNGYPVPAGFNGVFVNLFNADGGLPAGTFVKDIAFNATKAGKLMLVQGNDNFDAYTVLSTVNVVPEPMTMTLLGLGGLFFARKK